jgi:C-terminal processing protease CtpA/Prc
MKAKYILYAIFLAIVMFAYSCSDNNDDDQWSQTQINNHVNDWIYKEMSAWYYWNDKMPTEKNVNYNSDPENFFDNLLYNKNTVNGDRFSWIQENYVELLNALKGVTPRDLGFEYYTGSDYYLVVYVKPNTHAASQGIKRGQQIKAVNGTTIKSGINNPLTGADTYNITVYDPADDNTKDIRVNVEYNYAENPVYYSNTYSLSGGKKAGYLVYNQFTSDSGDNSVAYDRKLVDIFNGFISEGVSDIILDLRYNGGGSILTATRLASALVPNRSTDNIFSRNEYNKIIDQALKDELGNNYDSYINSRFVDDITYGRGKISIPELGTHIKNKGGKLYILTGSYTASASELIINGLKPYMNNDIVLIGLTTYGKNVGSVSLYKEDDDHNKWGMQPIVLKISNVENYSDYAAGFTPDYKYNEFVDDDRLRPFGDTDEILLATALANIEGVSLPAKKALKSSTEISGSSLENRKGAFEMFVDDKELRNLIK